MKAQTQKVRCNLLFSTEELFKNGEKKPTDYHDIVLTDIKFHQIIPRKSASLVRQAEKSIRNKKMGRAYSSNIKPTSNNEEVLDMSITLLDGNEIEQIKARSVRENKIIRILVPESGLPIYPAKDAVDFVNAHPDLIEKLQRKTRQRIDKNKNKRNLES